MSIFNLSLAILLVVIGFAFLGFSSELTNIAGGVCAFICAVLLVAGRN